MNINKVLIFIIFLFACLSLDKCLADEDFKKIVKDSNNLKPSFEYTGKESIKEMRKKSIETMAESIKVKWTPKTDFSYRKSFGAASKKSKLFSANKVYAGVPYTSAASGLFQWLYFYDYKTNVFDYEDWEKIEKNLGNSCAANVIWATAAVSKTISCGKSYTTFTMTPKNGWLPVGNYFYPKNLDSYDKNWDTTKIVASNSESVMFESYAKLQMADAILAASPLSGLGNAKHALMVVKEPDVTREGGKINGEKSYVYVQDQASGNYEKLEKNNKILYHGHLEYKITFKQLIAHGYIPLTTAEFLNKIPFEKSYCKFVGSKKNINTILKSTIESNYRIAVVECVAKTLKGEFIDKFYYLTKGKDVGKGLTTKFPLKQLLNKEKFKEINKESFLLTLNVTLCNGENYSLSDLKVSLK